MIRMALVQHSDSMKTFALQVRDHLLSKMLVFSEDDVSVIGHDRAGMARVSLLSNDFREAVRNHSELDLREGQQIELESFFRFFVELADGSRDRLNALPTVM
jgi:hypothetical protein